MEYHQELMLIMKMVKGVDLVDNKKGGVSWPLLFIVYTLWYIIIYVYINLRSFFFV